MWLQIYENNIPSLLIKIRQIKDKKRQINIDQETDELQLKGMTNDEDVEESPQGDNL